MKTSAFHRILTLLILSCGFSLATVLAAPIPIGDKDENREDLLPKDPQVSFGQLDNGLTYYIRKNEKPKNRAMLRLVVKAGSILEDDDQRGLAHFLEHMAFNGTKHFEKQALVNFMEEIGMRFGAHLNAYTSFDETVYMLEIPTDKPELMDKGLQVLEDWAHNISLDSDEIEKERGVVIEEWRRRLSANNRVAEKQRKVLLKDSRYDLRIPIGEVEILETAPREAFARFYQTWYRPELMAVIAVGDFEPTELEAKIKAQFQHLKNPKNPKERIYYPVPDHKETLYMAVTDPELTNTAIRIVYKHPVKAEGTKQAYRRSIVANMYETMLNQRLRELLQKKEPPFVFAYTGKGSLVHTKSAVNQVAMVREGKFMPGLEALLEEARRVREHGFTPDELKRAKIDYLRTMETVYNERDKTESSSFADEYVRNFLEGESMPGIAKELALVKELLPQVSLEEVNKAAQGWITEENRVILISAPEKESMAIPSKEEILNLISDVNSRKVTPYTDNASEEPLLAHQPEAGRIVGTEKVEKLGLTLWQLNNGVRVIFKPTEFKNDQIRMTSFSPGGVSLVDDADYVPAFTADTIIRASGLGHFDAIQLDKKLSGKIATAGPGIGSLEESISGSATVQDLETMFQLVYMFFTQPRVDENAFESMKKRWAEFVRNRESRPETVWSDKITATLYGDHPRAQPFTEETLEKMDMNKSLAIYKDRFADAGDFTFLIVGNTDETILKPLMERYLASLPSTGRKENWRDVGLDRKPGKHQVIVHKGLEPKSTVRLMYYGDAEWNAENRYSMSSLVEYLRIRLREVLREDKGGVYGVSVSGSLNRWPKEEYSGSIGFTCDPAKAESLIAAVNQVIAETMENGVEESYLNKIQNIQRKDYERGLEENGFWLNNLRFIYTHDLDPDHIRQYPERIEGLNSTKIQAAAKAYFNQTHYMEAILHPEHKNTPQNENAP